MTLETQTISAGDPQALDLALQALQAGELVAFPTDTVYGLAAALDHPDAIEALYAAKGRDSAKAIAVLLGDPAQLPQVAAEMGPIAGRLAARFWPGALTLVVPRHPDLPANLSPLPTIGVRMPDHPLALSLLRRAGPLAVTSANRSGEADARTAGQVFDQLAGRLALILDGGETPGGRPSTVVDCTGSGLVLLRPGPISYEALQSALMEAT